MIADLIRSFAYTEKCAAECAEEYEEISRAVAGDVTGAHFKNGVFRSGPEEYLICKKEEKHEKLIRVTGQLNMLKSKIHVSMQEIPDLTLREIIWLRYYHESTWEEIGKTVGMTGAAAKMRWNRFQKRGRKREKQNGGQDAAKSCNSRSGHWSDQI